MRPRRLAALALAGALTGCAVTDSPHTFALCRAADVATTITILKHGGVELNPLLHGLLAHGYLPFIALEAGVVGLVYWLKLKPEEQRIANAVSCLPPAWNLKGVLR